MFEIRGRCNTAHVFANEADQETVSQIMTLCNQEWAQSSYIAIMPDCHIGAGCTVGTTMSIGGRVCPNLVGVDIGCGMLTIELPEELGRFSLESLDRFINENVPSGFRVNERRVYDPRYYRLRLSDLRCSDALEDTARLERSVGSLGGGNHFIEIDRDEHDRRYLVIHTGSRGLGKQVAEHYQALAERDCAARGETAPKPLSWLEGRHLDDYLHDMRLCQRYAQVNRSVIAQRILSHLFEGRSGGTKNAGDASGKINVDASHGAASYQAGKGSYLTFPCFETVHNYIDHDDRILRKGAISAHEGERVLIPINMRDGSIIGTGRGNPAYNYSGPHGAGRILSRSEARKKLALRTFRETMEGIFTSSVCLSTIDESPMAYKPLESILDNIAETVHVERIIKPIYNFKAH